MSIRFSSCRLPRLCLAMAFCCLVPSAARAQLPQTRIFSVFPLGGQAGQSFDLTLTSGTDLEDVSRLLFTHPGITAAPKVQDVNGKKVPVLNTFTVTIAGNVPVGRYEVRAVGFFGISNPRAFQVGARAELLEIEPNNTDLTAQAIAVEQTVNGKMNGAADIDWYKFAGKAGQRLLGELYAQRLDSKFDGKLELYDLQKRRLGTAHYNIQRDPLLDVTLPADGEYLIKVTDFVYGGGEEFSYRLTLTTGPHLDFVLPPAGVPGTNGPFTLYGRNLPGGQPSEFTSQGKPLQKLTVNIAVPNDPTQLDAQVPLDSFSSGADGFAYAFTGPTGVSNSVLLSFAGSPVTMEKEPNNDPSKGQAITVPGEFSGQFQTQGDVDYFVFDAKAKDAYWVEVRGHSLGNGTDPYFTIDRIVVDDKGKETLQRVVAADDDISNPLPIIFETINNDASIKFTAPADGKYRLAVRDRSSASRGDAALIYRLTVLKERPDFRAVAVANAPLAPAIRQGMTWSAGLRRGDQVAIQVGVIRRDGFTGPVQISAEGLPPGVTCRDISIGAAPSSGLLVFAASEDAPAWAGTVKLTSKAILEDPALVEAQAAAVAGLKPAQDAFAAADKAVAKPADDLKAANEALAAAKKELDAKKDDEGLKKKVADAEAKLTAATAAHKTVADARTAAEQKAKDAETAIAQAKQAVVASRKEIVRPVRFGTVLYNGQPNIPGPARISQAIELSVIEEPAPFELLTDVHRVEANHNRQILVPVKVIRRAGFDNAVTMTFVGQPANVQVENKPIPKEKAEEVYRVFVPPNAPVGTYVMYLSGQQQVSYRKNPAKADRAKADLMEAEKALAAADEGLKTANTARDAAVKKGQDTTAALKTATDAKTAADKAFADAQTAEKAAEQGVKDAGANVDAKAAAEKKLADAKAVTAKAKETAETTEKARVEADKVAKEADAGKTKAEADAKLADDKNKAAAAFKTQAEQLSKQADDASKPANINYLPTTTPIVLTIKTAPFTVAAAPAESGNVKKGGKNEVKVTITRQNGFTGPATITLPLPPGVTGVKADAVTIPADKNEGVLVIDAAGDAPEAQLANMVVRVSAAFDGEAAVDAPVTLKVIP